MRGPRAYGSRQAARASGAVPLLVFGTASHTGAAARYRSGRGVERAVPRVGRDGAAGGSVYGDSVPSLGGVEGVAAAKDRTREYLGGGERVIWQCCRSGSGRGDDAARCAEDTHDVGKGEGRSGGNGGEDVAGRRAWSVF